MSLMRPNSQKIFKEDGVVIVLQLNQDKEGPVWRQTQIPARKRSGMLLMPVPRGGARSEGGLVVAGVTNKREGKNIFQGDLVCGQLLDKGP